MGRKGCGGRERKRNRVLKGIIKGGLTGLFYFGARGVVGARGSNMWGLGGGGGIQQGGCRKRLEQRAGRSSGWVERGSA